MKRWLLLLPAVLALAGIIGYPSEAKTVLVENGKPGATIVVGKNALAPAGDGALELQTYVQKITGAKLPIVTEDAEVSGAKILVGESRFTRVLGLKNANFKDQEYLIKTAGNDLILMGRDESAEDAEKIPGKCIGTLPPRKYYQKIGTIYAVDTFLEKFCGVRWYLPDELGEIVPQKNALEVGSINLRCQPSTRLRVFDLWGCIPPADCKWQRNAPVPPGKKVDAEKQLWWARRLKVGGEPMHVNHSLYGYYKRFGDKHPEWFAGGKPVVGNQLCLSNPEVVQQVVRDARDYFDGKLDDPSASAFGEVFPIVPADNAGSWCQCTKCFAQYDATRKEAEVEWGGFSGGERSDYVWRFISRVAKEVARTHPDKYIAGLGYHGYERPPEHVDIPPNVKVMLCKFHWREWDPKVLKRNREVMNAWRKKLKDGRNLYFWDYYCFPEYTDYEAFPSIAPHLIASNIQAMKKLGAGGGQFAEMLVSGQLYNLAMEHLRVYVTAKLLDDWDQDVDAILDEYYRLFYGPAAQPMKAFFERIENTYRADNPRLKPVIESRPEPEVTITIDLGSVQPIKGASFSTAAQRSSGVFWPRSIQVLGSADGRQYTLLGDLVKLSAEREPAPVLGALNPAVYHRYRFWTDRLKGSARYVRFNVKATEEYIFTDEIEVYGDD